MGMDANLYAVGQVTDEQLAVAEAFMTARVGPPVYDGDVLAGPLLVRRGGRIEVETLARWYGEASPKGWWPEIYNAILSLRAALPDCSVFYGSDVVADGREVTDELLADLWALWLSPNGVQ